MKEICGKCQFIKIKMLPYEPPVSGYLKIFQCHKLGRPVNPETIHADCPVIGWVSYLFTNDEIMALRELAETLPISAGAEVILDILHQAK